MPGLVGLVTKLPGAWAESQLTRMVEAIHHESFYGVGTWTSASQGLYVGWALRKNGFADQLPLRNERGDVAMAFSGEDFADPAAVRALKARGHAFDDCGASYLVHQYEEDPTFPAALNGRFQGVLADAAKGTATLFNDRWGMHRIYVHEAEEATYFAAEAKAILAVRPELRQLDEQALGEFVSCG